MLSVSASQPFPEIPVLLTLAEDISANKLLLVEMYHQDYAADET